MRKKFKAAFNGLWILLNNRNFIIHLVLLPLVCIAGIIFHISTTEWLVILLCTGLVLTAEGFNSSIEELSDLTNPRANENIKKIKDISAASVLIAAIISLIAGLIIFLPKIINLLLCKLL
jgi:diacylglycerol kinase